MIVTIHNNTNFPEKYELRRGQFRWRLLTGANKYDFRSGMSVYHKDKARPLCSWPLQLGTVEHTTFSPCDILVQTEQKLTITPISRPQDGAPPAYDKLFDNSKSVLPPGYKKEPSSA